MMFGTTSEDNGGKKEQNQPVQKCLASRKICVLDTQTRLS